MYKKIVALTLFASTFIYTNSPDTQPVLAQERTQTATLASADNPEESNRLKQACAAALGIGAIMTAQRLAAHLALEPFAPGLFTHTGYKVIREACEYTFKKKGYSEDFSTIHHDTNPKIYGVYDGHGGRAVAAYTSSHIKDKVLARLAHGNSTEDALTQSYLDIDSELPKHLGDDSKWQGSTALTAVVTPKTCTVANTGDSRAVLISGDIAFQLSTDHKPSSIGEHARILRAGGRVRPLPGKTEERVEGDLAMSRAIGDHRLWNKPGAGPVIPNPTIQKHVRSEKDLCIILATDGLWDKIDNETASTIVQNAFAAGLTANEAAQRLGNRAINRGSRDDITVVIVPLQKYLDQTRTQKVAQPNRLSLLAKASLFALTAAGIQYVAPELRALLQPRLVAV